MSPTPALLEMFAAADHGAAWSPLDLPGLVAWWDAADTATITESGGAVSQWDDKSGSGFHVAQGTGSKQPTTGATTLNGHNVIDFVRASAQVLSKASISTTMTSYFAVVKNATVPGTCAPVGTNHAAVMYVISANGPINLYTDNGGGASSSNNTTTGTPWTGAAIINGPSSILDLNGTSVDTVTDPGTSTSAQSVFVGNDSTGDYLNGFIAEIFVSSQVISGADFTAARSYLTGKWGTP